MSTRQKILAFSAGIIVAVLVLAFLSKDWLLRAAVEQVVTRLTGFKTEIGRLHYDFPSTIHVQELKIHNPAGFRENVFADLPEVYASLDLQPLLKAEKIHIYEIRLNLAEVHLEKNKEGISNVQLLSSVGGKGKQEEKPKPAAEKKMPFHLDRLELTMRQVSYEDTAGLVPSMPGESRFGKFIPKPKLPKTGFVSINVSAPKVPVPKKVAVDLNIQRQVFNDITDPNALVNLILVKIMYGTTFGKLLGVNPEMLLKDTMKDTLASGEELLKGASGFVTHGAADAAGEASDFAKSAQGQVTGLFGKFRSTAGAKPEENTSDSTMTSSTTTNLR